MPVEVTIDGRTIEVEPGTNLVDAALQAGVQIPHYCYHPRLPVVGQCRMCLVKIDGMGKLQTGCTTQVMKEGMVVHVDDDEVRAAQEGIMEFLLINHPLDCPICDQAGECGLQDYSFRHGQAFSRFAYEDKRTYPGKERIPLGANVLLNMNRCIQCTRCVRFTESITKTGELGFFQRGSRAEIGVFPGKELDNELSTCVVDVCPVGALTSTKFRFAERVWYLDKKPSLCTGCDAGCNITLEHRQGQIRRYKPRFNEHVNDYWMCDHGRTTFESYGAKRLMTPGRRPDKSAEFVAASWQDLVTDLEHQLASAGAATGILARGHATTEEAFVLARLAQALSTDKRAVLAEGGPTRTIPNPNGDLVGGERTPNRRGSELAGLPVAEGMTENLKKLLTDWDLAGQPVVILDGGLAGESVEEATSALYDENVLQLLAAASPLVVLGWGETPLSAIADFVLPIATHAETEGTFVNSQNRIQRFEKAFPPSAGVRTGTEALSDLLRRFDPDFEGTDPQSVFRILAAEVPALAGLTLRSLPASGHLLDREVREAS